MPLSACSGPAQAVLRHAQECSPSTQVKAAAAHVQILKRNQGKKKLSLTYMVVTVHLGKYSAMIGQGLDYD